jgi:hypothetical protein
MTESGRQLRSWKDIAAYLEVHERTVRRWERTRQLPVHRVGGLERDAVFADVAELEAWVATGKNRRAGVQQTDSEGAPPSSRDVSSKADPSPADVPAAPTDGRPTIRQGLAVAAAVALLGFVVTVALVVRGRLPSPAPEASPSLAAAVASSEVVASAGKSAARVVVLRLSNLDGTAVELALPEGVSGRTGGGPNRPALFLRPRLEDTGLSLEIRRADGQSAKPGGSPGEPAVILLQRRVTVRVLTPYAFDVEWIRTEEPDSPR